MRLLAVIVLALIWPLSAVAEDDPVDCRDGGMTQTDMNICSARAAAAAESFLKQVEAFLGRDEDAEGRALRGKAQSAWIQYATAQCNMEADFYRGGSIQPLIRNTCRRSLTLWRARWLLEGMFCDAEPGECVEQNEWLKKLEQVEKPNQPLHPDASRASALSAGERQR